MRKYKKGDIKKSCTIVKKASAAKCTIVIMGLLKASDGEEINVFL